MKVGENFTIIDIIKNADINKPELFITNILPDVSEQNLCLAKIIKISNTTCYDFPENIFVIIDETFIVYRFDEQTVVIGNSGILCAFDIDSMQCVTSPDFKTSVIDSPNIIVVKESIPPEEIFLLNPFIQNRLVIIGGKQTDYNIPIFDQPVIIAATPGDVKHIVTPVGDFYLCAQKDFILVFDKQD